MKRVNESLALLFVLSSAASAFVPSISVSHKQQRQAYLFGIRQNLDDAWRDAEQRGQNPAQVTVNTAKIIVEQSKKITLESLETVGGGVSEASLEQAAAQFAALGAGGRSAGFKEFLEEQVAEAEVQFYADLAEATQQIDKESFIQAIAEAEEKFHQAIEAAETNFAKKSVPMGFFMESADDEVDEVTLSEMTSMDRNAAIMDSVIENFSKLSNKKAPKIMGSLGNVLGRAAERAADLILKEVAEPALKKVGDSLKEAKVARRQQEKMNDEAGFQ